ncbi:MAG: hypothetical protein LBM13_06325 [Candidatus Ancillula sp.]|nr:hypothetical protein [Candidatus Ancillula sp.]
MDSKKLTAWFFVCALFLIFFSPIVISKAEDQSEDQLNQLIEQESQRQAQLNGELSGVSDQLKSVAIQVDQIQNYDLPKAQLELSNANSELDRTSAIAKDIEERLTAAKEDKTRIEKQLDTAKTGRSESEIAVASAAREDMQTPDLANEVQAIMGAGDSDDFIKNLEMNDQIGRIETRLLDKYTSQTAEFGSKADRLKAVTKKIDDLNNQAQANKKVAADAQSTAQAKKNEIANLQSQLASKQAQLQSQQTSLTVRIKRSEADQTALDNRLQKLLEKDLGPGGASTSGFDAGYIIADYKFYTHGTMTVGQIQDFLNSKGSSCSGQWCMKNYHVYSIHEDKDQLCSGFDSGKYLSAAEAISAVSNACNISEKALLVTLQKEQGLVTTPYPSPGAYTYALGYGCPDGAPCDPTHGGLFSQLYNAAWQFRNYQHLGTAYFGKVVGAHNYIRYNPSYSCGTKDVYIRNTATASLYAYTPYTPNAAALNAGFGTGDRCSSYGNRNFYLYYRSWFGSPK